MQAIGPALRDSRIRFRPLPQRRRVVTLLPDREPATAQDRYTLFCLHEADSLRAHGNDVSRYRRLLETNLSDLERRFLERRLNEEWSAMESLANPSISTYCLDWHGRPV
jgi:hypothetical protein